MWKAACSISCRKVGMISSSGSFLFNCIVFLSCKYCP